VQALGGPFWENINDNNRLLNSSAPRFYFSSLYQRAANALKNKTVLRKENGFYHWVEDGIARPPAGGLADP